MKRKYRWICNRPIHYYSSLEIALEVVELIPKYPGTHCYNATIKHDDFSWIRKEHGEIRLATLPNFVEQRDEKKMQYHSALATLLSIGIPRAQAVHALDATNGGLQEAARLLSEQLKQESKKSTKQHKRLRKEQKYGTKSLEKRVHSRARRENQKYRQYSKSINSKFASKMTKSSQATQRRVCFQESGNRALRTTRADGMTIGTPRRLSQDVKFRQETPMPKKFPFYNEMDSEDGSEEMETHKSYEMCDSYDNDEMQKSSNEENSEPVPLVEVCRSGKQITAYKKKRKDVKLVQTLECNQSVAKTRTSPKPENVLQPVATLSRSSGPAVVAPVSLKSTVPKQVKLRVVNLTCFMTKKPELLLKLMRELNSLVDTYSESLECSVPHLQRLKEQYPSGAPSDLLDLLCAHPTLLPSVNMQLKGKVSHA